ncbi:MAG: LAGLIDADG family homing endonuclease [Actinobacteria bacterium]|nr:LAGLIDADG family homing endonuclease [Actinomycetota bacterium]
MLPLHAATRESAAGYLLETPWIRRYSFLSHPLRRVSALEDLAEVFGCGYLIENRRTDNHRLPLMRFSVKRRGDLLERVVPFFEEHPLRTAKQSDFELFADVLRTMETGQHRTEEGLAAIAQVTERMNRKQRSRYLESSEAIRQPPQVPILR